MWKSELMCKARAQAHATGMYSLGLDCILVRSLDRITIRQVLVPIRFQYRFVAGGILLWWEEFLPLQTFIASKNVLGFTNWNVQKFHGANL
jgi:hypothetical protein